MSAYTSNMLPVPRAITTTKETEYHTGKKYYMKGKKKKKKAQEIGGEVERMSRLGVLVAHTKGSEFGLEARWYQTLGVDTDTPTTLHELERNI